MSTERAFVLFPLGKKRFALPAEQVTGLSHPDTIQTFPHTTPMLSGVLLRRGRIVPVCDVATALVGPGVPTRKFYLIATRMIGQTPEWTAVPVTGECELAKSEVVAPTGRLPQYVTGLLNLKDEIIEVVDLERLIHPEEAS